MINFTKEQIDTIVSQYVNGATLSNIGEQFSVSRATIQKVIKGNYRGYTGKKRASIASENQTKVCSKCHKVLPLDAFNRGNSIYGRRSFCRECEKVVQNTPERKARRRELEKKRRQDPEYVKRSNLSDRNRRYTREESYKKHLLTVARSRARKYNLDFNIDLEDVIIPKQCPLLEIPIFRDGRHDDNSCSLDRINSRLGYIKGNVWVVSSRANRIKNDASLEELEMIVKNLRLKVNENAFQ